MTTGTFSLSDLRAVRNASAASFGLDTINKVLEADLAMYNQTLQESMSYLAMPVTVQSMVMGTSATLDWAIVDEFGKPVTRKKNTGQTVSFPIFSHQAGLGFTEKWMQLHTPAELVEKYLQLRRGHAEQMLLETRKAIFNNVNYTHANDMENGVSLAVKRLINADSAIYPDEADGTAVVGSSHTHYLATTSGSFANADITGAVEHLTEHGKTKGIKILINAANKAQVSALTDFKALDLAVLAYSGVTSTIQKLDNSDTANQMIGYWEEGGYEVWVKPSSLVPANYILVVATGEEDKLLAYRQLPQPELQGLRIDTPMKDRPLIAENAEHIYGFGVYGRLTGAVLYKEASWANPTL